MEKDQIHNLKNEAIAQILRTGNKQELERLQIVYLGRKGKINQFLKELARLEREERTDIGKTLNEAKKAIENTLKTAFKRNLGKKEKTEEWFDITLPAPKSQIGHLHLISQAIAEIERIFAAIGFTRVRHPEVEWDWYSFEALNMPQNHPARDDFEAFYVQAPPSKKGQMCLTPHTSSGQIREMLAHQPPIRMINIGRCYRPESDISHAPVFHQFEGLYIDKNVNIGHLKGMLSYFAEEFFGPERKIRLRPYDFRFTEPSFEVDITCDLCQGKGRLSNGQNCRVCKEGWLELGGSGMTHPFVLKSGGVDPKKYSGFAFGWGVERVMMMKAGLNLPDLRLLWSPDLRILNQF
ncbi:MAG: phenylalanine--tRNA ligase subunit alpha [Candidatus Pacebacteria bacterium]|nr:phenylalanine--tRNA ligase subunit alpha [Candidatus Paceibacterota bacterium]